MPSRILLADDSPQSQRMGSRILSDLGYAVIAVGNGEAALRQIETQQPPDLLIADSDMPGLNGYELCARLGQHPRWSRIPVILALGIFETLDPEAERQARPQGILRKPFEASSLEKLVAELLDLSRQPFAEEVSAEPAAASYGMAMAGSEAAAEDAGEAADSAAPGTAAPEYDAKAIPAETAAEGENASAANAAAPAPEANPPQTQAAAEDLPAPDSESKAPANAATPEPRRAAEPCEDSATETSEGAPESVPGAPPADEFDAEAAMVESAFSAGGHGAESAAGETGAETAATGAQPAPVDEAAAADREVETEAAPAPPALILPGFPARALLLLNARRSPALLSAPPAPPAANGAMEFADAIERADEPAAAEPGLQPPAAGAQAEDESAAVAPDPAEPVETEPAAAGLDDFITPAEPAPSAGSNDGNAADEFAAPEAAAGPKAAQNDLVRGILESYLSPRLAARIAGEIETRLEQKAKQSEDKNQHPKQ